MGFLDKTIEALSGDKIKNPMVPVYKMVDTCAAEFAAETPYFYSTSIEPNGTIGENEAAMYLAERSI